LCKARAPIRLNLEPGSNISDESEVHSEKQSSQNASTEDGMHIDSNVAQSANSRDSIQFNLEPGSNVSEESDSQPQKHSRERISIPAGTDIEQQPENAPGPIRVSFDPFANVTAETELGKLFSPSNSI
jgi:hypothetical protein